MQSRLVSEATCSRQLHARCLLKLGSGMDLS